MRTTILVAGATAIVMAVLPGWGLGVWWFGVMRGCGKFDNIFIANSGD